MVYCYLPSPSQTSETEGDAERMGVNAWIVCEIRTGTHLFACMYFRFEVFWSYKKLTKPILLYSQSPTAVTHVQMLSDEDFWSTIQLSGKAYAKQGFVLVSQMYLWAVKFVRFRTSTAEHMKAFHREGLLIKWSEHVIWKKGEGYVLCFSLQPSLVCILTPN